MTPNAHSFLVEKHIKILIKYDYQRRKMYARAYFDITSIFVFFLMRLYAMHILAYTMHVLHIVHQKSCLLAYQT